MRRHSKAAVLGAVVGGLVSTPAQAADAKFEASSLEHALVARLDGREVRAASCRRAAGCDPASGKRFAIPQGAQADAATIETIELTSGRRLLLVSAPVAKVGGKGGGRWVLLLGAATKKGRPAVERKLQGLLDQPAGLEGEQRYKVLLREKDASGETLRVGRRYENADVCGRASLMKVQALDPYDLLWGKTPNVTLTAEERQKAPELTASPSTEPWPTDAPRILRGKLASSALGKSRSGLTDGDLSTRWTEGREGIGAGEFLVMDTSEDVAIEGFDLVLRPAKDDGAAAPKSLWLATRQGAYRVNVPADPRAAEPGTVHRVTLPAPVETDCVAVVLDEAYTTGKDERVGIVELRARTEFDGVTMTDMVAALDDPKRADAAMNVLLRNDAAGVQAAIEAFEGLSSDGQKLALDVIASGPCTATAAFYVHRVLGDGAAPDFDPAIDRMAGYARDQLRSCRGQAAEALKKAMTSAGPGQQRVWAARELAGIAPGAAIAAILEVLEEGSTAPKQSGGKDAVRRGLRASLATAAKHRRATSAVGDALAAERFAKLSSVQRIDLLRAVGSELINQPAAGKALETALAEGSFRTKYLLMEPAAHLAKAGQGPAVAHLRAALTGDNRHLRARAASLSGAVADLGAELTRALKDPAPRVRRAALQSVTAEGQQVSAAVEAELVRLLREDAWTFVRQEAARALEKRPPSPATDAALVATLEDAPDRVRVASLRALGKRGSQGTAAAILELADGANEPVFVRSAAIKALGDLCHRDAVPFLYKLALRAGYQQLPYDQPLGLAALAALGVLRPSDMATQLRPMLHKNRIVPTQVRAIVRSLLASPAKPCQPR